MIVIAWIMILVNALLSFSGVYTTIVGKDTSSRVSGLILLAASLLNWFFVHQYIYG
ncbi:hypothetical protein GMB34_13695 [Turicibacter sanguinis]|nr:hypothetical protein [Turicibacter sanguinis]MTN85271.1 hypothetical protein [Turicibacter sanguinis]MTN88092.1 hypothetical protein [Turicibacter sanguinis]MTN90946.1 hypothetical protein [Turicibacter sanguinis]MTN93775.1 hypothetical protein [Turicibacter sanguinis]